MEFQNWTEKYRAIISGDIKGQELAINQLKTFLKLFPNDKKAIILHGPAGIGKTSLAHVMKNELDLEIFELNASDLRNKEQLLARLKPASEQISLFKKGKILLVDEVDGLSLSDRGGLPELLELVNETQFPMIITANNIWDAKFAELRKKCLVVGLKDVGYKDISLILQSIAKKENLDIDNQLIISLSVRANGDVRAAINDLQTISHDKDIINSYTALDQRNKEQDIFTILKFVFKNMLSDETLRIYDKIDLPLDKIFLWIEENIPYEYSGEELYKAYEALSLADVFRGRIREQRYWRFLVYENIFLSAGISLAKKKPKLGYTHYQKPTRILKIWMNNNKNIHKNSILIKYAAATHCSKNKAAKEFNLVKIILKKPELQKELRLNEKEIEYIMK